MIVTATSLAGIWLICAAMTGYFARLLDLSMRAGFAAAGVLLMLPHQASPLMLWLNFAGLALGVALVARELKARRRSALA